MSENLFTKAFDLDKKLPTLEKIEMKQLATMFNAELESNIFLGSFALAQKYPEVAMEAWKEFLDYPPVKRIVKELTHETLDKKASKSLSDGVGTRDAIALRKALKEDTTVESNINYVIMMLPNKERELDE